jgi:hypothetical protein
MMRAWIGSVHCESRVHCAVCRDPVAGQAWRRSIAAAFDVPAADWDCPFGIVRAAPGDVSPVDATADGGSPRAYETLAAQVESLLLRQDATPCQRARWTAKAAAYRRMARGPTA